MKQQVVGSLELVLYKNMLYLAGLIAVSGLLNAGKLKKTKEEHIAFSK